LKGSNLGGSCAEELEIYPANGQSGTNVVGLKKRDEESVGLMRDKSLT